MPRRGPGSSETTAARNSPCGSRPLRVTTRLARMMTGHGNPLRPAADKRGVATIADMDGLARLGADGASTCGVTLQVPAGESLRECMIVGSDVPELHRIRRDLGRRRRERAFSYVTQNTGRRYTLASK